MYACTPSQLDNEDYETTQIHLGLQEAFSEKEEQDAEIEAARAKRKKNGNY